MPTHGFLNMINVFPIHDMDLRRDRLQRANHRARGGNQEGLDLLVKGVQRGWWGPFSGLRRVCTAMAPSWQV